MILWMLLFCNFRSTESWKLPPTRQSSVASYSSTLALSAAAADLTGVAATGVSLHELESVKHAVTSACKRQAVSVRFDDDDMMLMEEPINKHVFGATGRALLLQASNDFPKEDIEDLIYLISREIDEILYSDAPISRQPILIAIERGLAAGDISREKAKGLIASRIEDEVKQYEMNLSLPYNTELASSSLVPTLRVEVDGALVTDPSTNEEFWDTSSLLVFDGLVSDDLRRRMLNVVNGNDENSVPTWNDGEKGPDPRRWIRGGLVDTPDDTDDESMHQSQDNENGSCWGLKKEAIAELCFEHHDALQEMETIISSSLFPQFTVSRLSEAVLGEGVSPLTANAATFGDSFDWHIDADPNLTPPSPWTDVYGRYPNRCKGKPRFMSCLIYLNDEWREEWGAPTRFLDVATDTHYDVQAKPGRVVIMDQDITHSVVAPLEAAGKRPRYSLVWKLILHPKHRDQDMTNLQSRRDWPGPLLLGSAAREENAKEIRDATVKAS